MAKYTHDIVATVGKYTQNGEEKKRYVNVGKAFQDDQGRISLKLDTIPVGPEWSGQRQAAPAPAFQGRPSPPPPLTQEEQDGDHVPF
jgi:hypothetical protein